MFVPTPHYSGFLPIDTTSPDSLSAAKDIAIVLLAIVGALGGLGGVVAWLRHTQRSPIDNPKGGG